MFNLPPTTSSNSSAAEMPALPSERHLDIRAKGIALQILLNPDAEPGHTTPYLTKKVLQATRVLQGPQRLHPPTPLTAINPKSFRKRTTDKAPRSARRLTFDMPQQKTTAAINSLSKQRLQKQRKRRRESEKPEHDAPNKKRCLAEPIFKGSLEKLIKKTQPTSSSSETKAQEKPKK